LRSFHFAEAAFSSFYGIEIVVDFRDGLALDPEQQSGLEERDRERVSALRIVPWFAFAVAEVSFVALPQFCAAGCGKKLVW